MADKYKNINKVLKKYGQKTITDIKTIVGVKTGALKDSIEVNIIKDEGYIVKMLSYGKYISPWSKGNGTENYIQIFKSLKPEILKELEKGYAKDVANQIRNNAKKHKNLKVK